MAQDTSLNGLRSQLLTQIYGRRLALDPNDYLVGPKAVREQVSGVAAAGSTIVSTSVASNIDAFGITLVGATAASATTAYTLAAPVPGVKKGLFNPTTGQAVILTTGAGAFICSTASITSTQGTITLVGKGAYVELWGLTTNLWGLAENLAITTVTTGNLVQIS